MGAMGDDEGGERNRSLPAIEPRNLSTIVGPGSQLGFDPRSLSTILGPPTILGTERWFQSLLRFALCSSPC